MLDKSTGGVAAAYGMREEKDGVDVLHNMQKETGALVCFSFDNKWNMICFE